MLNYGTHRVEKKACYSQPVSVLVTLTGVEIRVVGYVLTRPVAWILYKSPLWYLMSIIQRKPLIIRLFQ